MIPHGLSGGRQLAPGPDPKTKTVGWLCANGRYPELNAGGYLCTRDPLIKLATMCNGGNQILIGQVLTFTLMEMTACYRALCRLCFIDTIGYILLDGTLVKEIQLAGLN